MNIDGIEFRNVVENELVAYSYKYNDTPREGDVVAYRTLGKVTEYHVSHVVWEVDIQRTRPVVYLIQVT